MPIYAGNSKIKEIYAGNSKIKEVWVGSSKVFSSGVSFDGLSIKDLCFLHVTANSPSEYWGICSEEWFNLMSGLSAYNFEFTSITCDYPEIEDDVYSLYAWRHARKTINITASFPSGYDFLVMSTIYKAPTVACVPSFDGEKVKSNKIKKVTGGRVITLSIPSTGAASGAAFVTAIFKVPTGYNSPPNISIGIAANSTNNNATVYDEYNETQTFGTPTFGNKLNLYITGPAGTSNDHPVKFDFQDGVTTQTIQQETIWEDPSTPMLVSTGGSTTGISYIPYIGFKTKTGPT